jgi:hypothetical protein
MQLAFEFQDRGAPATEPGPDDLEMWCPIDGWPGYEVSDWGRVRSYWGPGGGSQGRRGIGLTPKIIGGYVLKKGHRSVLLYRNHSTEKRRVCVHILVLETFVGPCPPGMECCHNDGNPGNNRLSNLRWDTRSSNQKDALKHGAHGTAKVTEAMVPAIWRRLILRDPDAEIARDFGVSNISIHGIKSGRHWSYITRNLPGWPLVIAARTIDVPPVFVPPELARTDEELWCLVPDWPAYRISNRGRTQTCWKRCGRNRPVMTDMWKEKVASLDKDGYPRTQLSDGKGRVETFHIHDLVLTAFAGPKPHPAMVCCHIDGDKLNNHASNLRWDSPKSNALDAVRRRRPRPPE